ncbi:MAG: ACT domain-containing protein [Thermoplasmata archaeon]|nr:MAG: ACT domain-containing protein [Thermoplasmata archaeon]
MKEFKIFVEDKPGELARVTESLASRAVNIKAIASETAGNKAFLRVVTNDVTSTEKALSEASIGFEQSDILNISLIDRPGELAKVAKKLGKAKINIRSIYILGQRNGKTELALVVDNMSRAEDLLR